LKIRDIAFGMGACTNSSFARQFELPGHSHAPITSFELLQKAVKVAENRKVYYKVGNFLSSDTFYDDSQRTMDWAKMGVLCVEMEAAALYMNAARAGKNALAICTISDSIVTGEQTTSEERQNSFHEMMEIALVIA
jgi:purine-nucleoside phosphorylase